MRKFAVKFTVLLCDTPPGIVLQNLQFCCVILRQVLCYKIHSSAVWYTARYFVTKYAGLLCDTPSGIVIKFAVVLCDTPPFIVLQNSQFCCVIHRQVLCYKIRSSTMW